MFSFLKNPLGFLRFYLFIFREKGREGEREGEKHRYARETLIGYLLTPPTGDRPTTQACALTRNQTGDLSVHRLVLIPLSHASQGLFIIFKCFTTKEIGVLNVLVLDLK